LNRPDPITVALSTAGKRSFFPSPIAGAVAWAAGFALGRPTPSTTVLTVRRPASATVICLPPALATAILPFASTPLTTTVTLFFPIANVYVSPTFTFSNFIARLRSSGEPNDPEIKHSLSYSVEFFSPWFSGVEAKER
jgi:hypothetical protein